MARSDTKNLSLRLPIDLHAQLLQRASQQGVSLNQLITLLLAGGIGFELGGPKKLVDCPRCDRAEAHCDHDDR